MSDCVQLERVSLGVCSLLLPSAHAHSPASAHADALHRSLLERVRSGELVDLGVGGHWVHLEYIERTFDDPDATPPAQRVLHSPGRLFALFGTPLPPLPPSPPAEQPATEQATLVKYATPFPFMHLILDFLALSLHRLLLFLFHFLLASFLIS